MFSALRHIGVRAGGSGGLGFLKVWFGVWVWGLRFGVTNPEMPRLKDLSWNMQPAAAQKNA